MMNGDFSQWDRMTLEICMSWMYNSIFYFENRMGRPWVIYYDSPLPFLFISYFCGRSRCLDVSCMCVITNILCFMLPLSCNKHKPMGLWLDTSGTSRIYVVQIEKFMFYACLFGYYPRWEETHRRRWAVTSIIYFCLLFLEKYISRPPLTLIKAREPR